MDNEILNILSLPIKKAINYLHKQFCLLLEKFNLLKEEIGTPPKLNPDTGEVVVHGTGLYYLIYSISSSGSIKPIKISFSGTALENGKIVLKLSDNTNVTGEFADFFIHNHDSKYSLKNHSHPDIMPTRYFETLLTEIPDGEKTEFTLDFSSLLIQDEKNLLYTVVYINGLKQILNIDYFIKVLEENKKHTVVFLKKIPKEGDYLESLIIYQKQ